MKNCLILLIVISFVFAACEKKNELSESPNILWITIEDLTPMLGCYGDPVAQTPNIDQLAQNGVKYTNAFATAAVCSPARSCLLTGVYATTLGTQHLRSETEVPESIIPFPKYLRDIGYYCTNNYKEDYNFNPGDVWDESSKTAHWKNRKAGQPFFSVFNLETTHQSRIFGTDSAYQVRFREYLPRIIRTEPKEIILPPYFFDTWEIRKLWARYYDNVQIVDLQVKEILEQLRDDELDDNTIIFFYSDHGTGMPRGKRALYDSGLKVPLIIVAPDKYKEALNIHPGSENTRLVSFVDFAPTILNLLGIDAPSFMQGLPFLGPDSDNQNEYVYATADRVDEAYEVVRSVRTEKFRYIRNFLPHLPLIQPNYYSDQSEIMKEVYRVRDTISTMTDAQKSMWLKKRPVEELYSIEDDPFEIQNLASNPSYSGTLKRMRHLNTQVMLDTHDSGLAPESYMYEIAEGTTPYEILQDSIVYPIKKILKMMDELHRQQDNEGLVLNYLNEPSPLVNYWAIICLQYQNNLNNVIMDKLIDKLNSPYKFVSTTAAETLCKFGKTEIGLPVLMEAINGQNQYNQLMAARALELLGEKSNPYRQQIIEAWDKLKVQTDGKWKGYDLYSLWALNELLEK
jgi:N-sulfoglucosamine sulfohydrolase